jgi:hypothetical protein
MEIMSKVKYVFAKKINETEETGIIEVYSAKILCFCDEESSKFIIDSIEAKEQLQTLQDFTVQELSCKTEEPYDKNGFTQLGREFIRLNGKKISEPELEYDLVLPPPIKTAEELVLNYEDLTNAQKIIDDKTLEEIFGYSDFGRSWTKREILNNGVLKYASGYETGRTVQCICIALGLYDEKKGLTQKGREYLYAAYNGGKSV